MLVAWQAPELVVLAGLVGPVPVPSPGRRTWVEMSEARSNAMNP